MTFLPVHPIPPIHWRVAFGGLCIMPLLLATTRAGSDIVVVLIGMLFLLHSHRCKAWHWVKKPELFVLGVLWVYMMLAAWDTPFNHVTAFQSALIWGRLPLFYAAMRYWLLIVPEAFKPLNQVGLFVLLLVAIDTLWQYQTGTSLSGRDPIPGDRLTGPLTKPVIGMYILKVGFPMLGLAAYRIVKNDPRRQLLYVAAGLLTMITIIMVSGEPLHPATDGGWTGDLQCGCLCLLPSLA